MRVIITGTTGFVGACLKRFYEEKSWKVSDLNRRSSEFQFELRSDFKFEKFPEVQSGATSLIHCAYDFEARTWEEIRDHNIEGSRVLFEEAKRQGVEKIVLISSISAYEGCRSMYGRAKYEIEQIAKKYGAAIIRPGLIYDGDGQSGGMMGALEKLVKKSPLLPVIASNEKLFLCHQADLCRLVDFYVSGNASPSPAPLIAASSQGYTLAELLRKIASRDKRSLNLIPMPWPLVWGGLKTVETLGLRLRTKSDSLVSLVNPNPDPAFHLTKELGVEFRDFR